MGLSNIDFSKRPLWATHLIANCAHGVEPNWFLWTDRAVVFGSDPGEVAATAAFGCWPGASHPAHPKYIGAVVIHPGRDGGLHNWATVWSLAEELSSQRPAWARELWYNRSTGDAMWLDKIFSPVDGAAVTKRSLRVGSDQERPSWHKRFHKGHGFETIAEYPVSPGPAPESTPQAAAEEPPQAPPLRAGVWWDVRGRAVTLVAFARNPMADCREWAGYYVLPSGQEVHGWWNMDGVHRGKQSRNIKR